MNKSAVIVVGSQDNVYSNVKEMFISDICASDRIQL